MTLYRTESQCRICGARGLRPFLNLGEQPWCNDFVTREQVGHERRYPLHLYFCDHCTTVQVGHTVPKEVMFSDHLYLSGTTRTMRAHFAAVAAKTRTLLQSRNRPFDMCLTVDIGSNDGTLLSEFRKLGAPILGVEPCRSAADIALANGVPTVKQFLDEEVARQIRSEHGEAQIISAANVFYHVEDLHSILRGIKSLLARDGVFVMQGSYLPRIMETRAFDIMYHEHLLYYRLGTLEYLLKLYDMEAFDVDEHPVHGGSVVVYVGNRGRWSVNPKVRDLISREIAEGYSHFDLYERFSQEVSCLRDEIITVVRDKLRAGARVYCYGAPAKGTVMLNYCGFTSADMPLAVEKNPLKLGRFIPGTGIEIVNESATDEPDYYFLLAWNFLSEFLESPPVKARARKFIVPLPHPRVVP